MAFDWKQTIHTKSDYVEVRFADRTYPHRISVIAIGNRWEARYDGKPWVNVLPFKTRQECKRYAETCINRILFAEGGSLL